MAFTQQQVRVMVRNTCLMIIALCLNGDIPAIGPVMNFFKTNLIKEAEDADWVVAIIVNALQKCVADLLSNLADDFLDYK